MTGRFPKATRVRENSALGNVTALSDIPTMLREQGYSINIAGKNHSYVKKEDFDWVSMYMHNGGGREDRRTKDDAAFDEWLVSLDHHVFPEPSPFPLENQLPFRVVSDAMACLEARKAEQPFFLWLSFAEPHNPYQVPEPYFSMFPEEDIPDREAGLDAIAAKGGKWQWLRDLIEEKRPGYDDTWRRFRATYLGMIRLIDDQIRRFVEHLEATGELENTVLIFMSDHGDYAGEYGLQRKGVDLPECLVRVPLMFAGPGIRRNVHLRSEFVSLVDVFPTLCEMLEAPIPDGVQGRSLWPLLSGEEFPEEEFRSIYVEIGIGGLHYTVEERPELHFPYEGASFDCLNSVTQSGNLKLVRMGDWALLMDSQGNGQMYDLASDPAEVTNLFGDSIHRDKQLEMTTELLRWTIRTEDDLPGGRYVRKRPAHNWFAPMTQATGSTGRDLT
jgi:arylsulfatase A-like enzyme